MADPSAVIRDVQYLVAPAVMVSSAALLLLGQQNKLSSLASRFRALHHEQRSLAASSRQEPADAARLRSLRQQVAQLMRRATYVKDAIILSHSAIICFAGTSVLVFASAYAPPWLGRAAIALFMVGLACLLGAASLMIRETQLFHAILRLEHASHDADGSTRDKELQ